MRRRSKAGGEPVKTRRRKAATVKRRTAPKAVRRSGPSNVGQQTEVARLTRERDDALEQQAATHSLDAEDEKSLKIGTGRTCSLLPKNGIMIGPNSTPQANLSIPD
jgi:hypothetical protein